MLILFYTPVVMTVSMFKSFGARTDSSLAAEI